jgi:hypothetical protein
MKYDQEKYVLYDVWMGAGGPYHWNMPHRKIFSTNTLERAARGLSRCYGTGNWVPVILGPANLAYMQNEDGEWK